VLGVAEVRHDRVHEVILAHIVTACDGGLRSLRQGIIYQGNYVKTGKFTIASAVINQATKFLLLWSSLKVAFR
jgi:hypothetical protein